MPIPLVGNFTCARTLFISTFGLAHKSMSISSLVHDFVGNDLHQCAVADRPHDIILGSRIMSMVQFVAHMLSFIYAILSLGTFLSIETVKVL